MIILEAELRVAIGLFPTITDTQRARLALAMAGGHAAVRKKLCYDPEQRLGPAEFYPRNEPSSDLYANGVWDRAGNRAVFESSDLLGRYLQLQRLPVRAVTELRVDPEARGGQQAGDFGTDSIWTPGEDFQVEWDEQDVCRSGHLIALSGWPATNGTVKATYRGGYSGLEFNGPSVESYVADDGTITTQGVDASPIKSACLLACLAQYHTYNAWAVNSLTGQLAAGPLQSERLGDYSYQLASAQFATLIAGMAMSMPPQAAELLEPFVNYGILVG